MPGKQMDDGLYLTADGRKFFMNGQEVMASITSLSRGAKSTIRVIPFISISQRLTPSITLITSPSLWRSRQPSLLVRTRIRTINR